MQRSGPIDPGIIGCPVVAIAICALMALPRVGAAAGAEHPPAHLRLVTYNVLADPVLPEQRVAAIASILAAANADIIALQEVAPWFANRLLREPWTDAYHRVRKDERTVIVHEFLILSRFPVVAHHTAPLAGVQRRVLHRIVVEVDGAPLAIATCHLESLLDDGAIRAAQLDMFFADLAPQGEAVFLGDFNFGEGEQPESAHLPADFLDAWRIVHPRDPGYTWDRRRSAMARRESFPGERSRRLDRVLVKSRRWQPVAAELLGDVALPGTKPVVFPSDHFGVLVELRQTTAAPEAGTAHGRE